MLSRLFPRNKPNSSSGGRAESRGPLGRSGKSKARRLQEEEEKRRAQEVHDADEKRRNEMAERELERRKGDIMNRTEMTSSRMDFNQGAMGLVDRMEAHQAGTYMKNVVISNKPPPDRELNLARLRTYKMQNDQIKMSLSDIEPFDLTKEYHEFPLTHAMTEEQYASLKPYCLVSDIFVHYVPLDTFFSVSSPVNFFVNDFRKVEDTTARNYSLTHSGGYNILFSLDYCVRTVDLNLLTMSISTSLASFRKDIAWASVKVIVTLTHMDFPIKANIQETMGVLHLADSDLQDFISDPRGSDGVITPEALSIMKRSFKRGDIENIHASKDDTKEINTAKTEFKRMDASADAADLLRNLRTKHLAEERERSEQEPISQEIVKMPKGALKKVDEEEKAFIAQKLEEELTPGESLSQASDDETVSLPRREGTPPRKMRAVNWGSA